MGLVQGEDLPARLARVAEARDGVALKVRFAALVPLEGVVAVQSVVLAKYVADIAGQLVDVDWRCAGADEPVRRRALAGGISGNRLRTIGSVTAARWASVSTPLLKSSSWRWRVLRS